MRTTNFMYDNQSLYDMGYIICDFNASAGVSNVSIGSEITFTKVPRGNGRKYGLVNTKYDNCITTEFDICKDPCKYSGAMAEISQEQMRVLTRWLNRREFLPCYFYYDGEDYPDVIYYDASFNVERIMIAEKIVGLHLKMETNAPFGYGEEEVYEFPRLYTSLDDWNVNWSVTDTSDEVGDLFPDVVITCQTPGNLTLRNNLTGSNTIIKNCMANEVITLHGDTKIIETNKSTHKIQNDFNWEFPRIGNRLKNGQENRRNTFEANRRCKVKITFRPIIKDTP